MQNEIDLWIWSAAADQQDIADMREALAASEVARSARFAFVSDATRFISRRFRVRQILGSYLSCAPDLVALVDGAHGKPFLSPMHNSDLQFNLSHSEDLAVLAIARGLEVGVDVERVRPISEGVAQRFFSPAESTRLATLPAESAIRGFYECWTGKEAFVKALGSGLSVPLDSFDVTFGPGSQSAITRIETLGGDEVGAWRLWRFEPALGFVAAVAARTAGYPWELKICSSG